MAAGLDRVDLRYSIPASASTTMGKVSELLDRVYAELGDDTLLAVRPEETLLALQHWYLGEFVAQGRGEPPTPWTGPTSLER